MFLSFMGYAAHSSHFARALKKSVTRSTTLEVTLRAGQSSALFLAVNALANERTCFCDCGNYDEDVEDNDDNNGDGIVD
jgi:hypothetical protein